MVIYRRVIGRVDHLFANIDQLPAHREIIDRATIGFGVDDRRCFGCEARKILRDGHAADVLLADKCLQRDRRRELARKDQRFDDVIYAAMKFFGEMRRLKKNPDTR